MKWTIVLLALVASMGDTARVKNNEGKDADVEQALETVNKEETTALAGEADKEATNQQGLNVTEVSEATRKFQESLRGKMAGLDAHIPKAPCKFIDAKELDAELLDAKQLDAKVMRSCEWKWLITVSGPLYYKSIRFFTRLDLYSRAIGDKELEKLAALLPYMPILSYLDLNRNPIGDVGAEKLAELLPKMTKLRTLVLSDTNIGDLGADALMGAFMTPGRKPLLFSFEDNDGCYFHHPRCVGGVTRTMIRTMEQTMEAWARVELNQRELDEFTLRIDQRFVFFRHSLKRD